MANLKTVWWGEDVVFDNDFSATFRFIRCIVISLFLVDVSSIFSFSYGSERAYGATGSVDAMGDGEVRLQSRHAQREQRITQQVDQGISGVERTVAELRQEVDRDAASAGLPSALRLHAPHPTGAGVSRGSLEGEDGINQTRTSSDCLLQTSEGREAHVLREKKKAEETRERAGCRTEDFLRGIEERENRRSRFSRFFECFCCPCIWVFQTCCEKRDKKKEESLGGGDK